MKGLKGHRGGQVIVDETFAAKRRERRRTAREVAAAKVEELQQWRLARIQAAEKRAAAARKAAAKSKESRGVHRVPAHLQGLAVTETPYTVSRVRQDGRGGRALAQPEDLHPDGNYATRRARGQRGHERGPRRRDMPVAMARRIERNRKQWSQA